MGLRGGFRSGQPEAQVFQDGLDDLPVFNEGQDSNVPGQVFHGNFILGKYALPAEDLESGMPPVGKHGQ